MAKPPISDTVIASKWVLVASPGSQAFRRATYIMPANAASIELMMYTMISSRSV